MEPSHEGHYLLHMSAIISRMLKTKRDTTFERKITNQTKNINVFNNRKPKINASLFKSGLTNCPIFPSHL